MPAGAGGQHQMARPAGPAGSGDWFGCERPHVPGDGGAVWGERGQRCEVVAALAASGSAAAKPMGGWKQLLLTSEREWLLARIAEKPDLTLRAVVGELAERGTPANYWSPPSASATLSSWTTSAATRAKRFAN